MHPELLEAACHGSRCRELTNLLNGGAADVPIEVVVDIDRPGRSPSSSLLLEGVTPDGDSALHIVAAYGHLEKARAVYGKAPHLLGARNGGGGTPLHCAARAGRAAMAALLVELARVEEVAGEDGRVETLVRMQNELGETALHEAIRAGHMLTVAELMTADPFLARVPENGTSPSLCDMKKLRGSCTRETRSCHTPGQMDRMLFMLQFFEAEVPDFYATLL